MVSATGSCPSGGGPGKGLHRKSDLITERPEIESEACDNGVQLLPPENIWSPNCAATGTQAQGFAGSSRFSLTEFSMGPRRIYRTGPSHKAKRWKGTAKIAIVVRLISVPDVLLNAALLKVGERGRRTNLTVFL